MVAISSIAAAVTHPFMGPYCVSKAGVDMLVRQTADELGRAGVRVNAVRPGIVATDLVSMVMDDEQVNSTIAELERCLLDDDPSLARRLRRIRRADGARVVAVVAALTAAATLSVVLGTMAAYVLVRAGKFLGRTVFQGMIFAPLVMPEVITGLSLLLLFVAMAQLVGWPAEDRKSVV